MYQWMNGGAPMTGYTSNTNIALQNLQPNAMYTVLVVGINLCGVTSDITNNMFHLYVTWESTQPLTLEGDREKC